MLDDALIDRVVTRHPSPIADAIVALAAAESVHERRDRVVEAFRVVLRYLAAISLAARLAKRPPDGDGDQLAKLIETLRSRSLTDGQWWHLVRELARPWKGIEAQHPIPPLVAAVANAKLGREIDALLGMRKSETVAHGTTGSREGVVAILAEREPALARVLAAIEPIHAAARLVVGEPAIPDEPPHAKSLVGATPVRAMYRRVPVGSATSVPLEPARCYLVDEAGAVTVDLDPLIRFGAPAVGALPEVFFLDGRTPRGGGRYLSLPAASERSEPQVWDRLDAAFAPPPPDPATTAAAQRPYRGLARFEKRDAAMFFGRDLEIEDLANRIRANPLVTLTGPSGSGKSSLLAAGVTSALAVPVPATDTARRGAIAITVRPGRDLARELAAALELEDIALEQLAATARQRAGDRMLVVIIDQAEELLTLSDPESAMRGAQLLVELGTGDPLTTPTRVVISVREDFFAQLARLGPLRNVYDRQVMVLGPLDKAAMLRAVIEPAAAFGVRYEAGVAEAMVDDIYDRPGALPLLQFCADRLWDVRSEDGDAASISRAEYDSIGGVSGALATHAEAIYARLLPSQQDAARNVMLRLVTREGTRTIVPRDELARLPEADAVLARLEESRLVTTHQDAFGTGVCELVHEALIAHWPRLADWRKAEGDGAAHVARIADAARAWRRGDRPRDLLWRGDVLAEHRRWAARVTLPLTPDEATFILASETDETRARRRRRLVIGAVAIVLAAIAAVALVLWRRASAAEVAAAADAARAEATARANALQAMVARAREYGATGHTAEELVVLRALIAAGDDGRALALADGFIWKAHQRLASALPPDAGAMVRANDGALTTAVVGPDLVQWNARGAEVHRMPLPVHPGLRAAGVSPRGTYAVVVACGDKTPCDATRSVYGMHVTIRAIATNQDVETVSIGGGMLLGDTSLAFAPDDSTIALHDFAEAKIRLVHPAVSGPPTAVPDHECHGIMRFTRRGEHLAIGCAHAIRVLDVASGKDVELVTEHEQPRLLSIVANIVTYVDEDKVVQWDTHAGTTAFSPAVFSHEIPYAAFEPGPDHAPVVPDLPPDPVAHPTFITPVSNTAGAHDRDADNAPHFFLDFASASLDIPLEVIDTDERWSAYLDGERVVDDTDLPATALGSRCLAPPGERTSHTLAALDRGRAVLVDEVELVPFAHGGHNRMQQLSNAQLPIRAYRPARIASSACAQWEPVLGSATIAALDTDGIGAPVQLADGRLVLATLDGAQLVDRAGKVTPLHRSATFTEGGRYGMDFDDSGTTVIDTGVTPPALTVRPGTHPDGMPLLVAGAIVFIGDPERDVMPLDPAHETYVLGRNSELQTHSPYALVPVDDDDGALDEIHLADQVHHVRAGIPFASASLLDDASGRIISGGDIIDLADHRVQLALTGKERIDNEHQTVDAGGHFLADPHHVWDLATGAAIVHEPAALGMQIVGDEAWWIANPPAPRLVRMVLATKQRTEVPLAIGALPFFEAADIVGHGTQPVRVAISYRVDRTFNAQAIFDATTGTLLWVGTSANVLAGDWIVGGGRTMIPDFDVAHLMANTGARTNLRPCKATLAVVGVIPPPTPDAIWAPDALCQTPGTGSRPR